MTSAPPGWYPDPTPPPGVPPLPRWWDGAQWTDHYGPVPVTGPPPATTPDGVPLAGWGERLVALIVDALILAPVMLLLGLPFLLRMFDGFVDQFEEVTREAQRGEGQPVFVFPDNYLWLMLGWVTVSLVVSMLYEMGFLRWKQATPGKLLLGLQVRLRERPGRLAWRTIGLRWVVKNAASFVSWVPLAGGLLGAAWLVNFLWPLWDDHKQALHDKAAATNVVRVR